MKLVDANVLIYAVDQTADHHDVSRGWLDAHLPGPETLLLPWVSLLAFVRIVTHPAVYERPLAVAQALDIVGNWVAQPAAVTPEPDGSHIGRMHELLASTGRGGNLVNDAHLAALALQHRATVVTFDNDFGRFQNVLWEHPTIPAA